MRGRVCALLVGLVFVVAWSAAIASARSEDFSVNYSGAGTLTSRIKSLTSPQCGDVTEVRNETTQFSWVTHYFLKDLVVGSRGLKGTTAEAEPKPSSLVSNSSRITLSETGCQTGIADCRGESHPDPGHKASVSVSNAPRGGRARAKVEAVGGFGFLGKAFSGGWGFPTGSCAFQFDGPDILLPELNLPNQLEASFPVKVSTLASLPLGHYFKVRIHAGHYAPAHHHFCFAASGCLKDDFTWHGVVEFKRIG